MRLIVLFYVFTTCVIYAQPPYSGTIFIDQDIITSNDPSALESTTYREQGMVTMFDRRINNWVTVNAYLFDVIWDDGLTSVAQINAEFGSVSAAKVEAEKYAFLIGQLPNILRKDVNEIWVHKGIELFGGGNNSILIHTGQTANYERDGILEETLVHEASHTSLDAAHATSSGWQNAQNLDNEFISTYARDNPTREDIAESFLPWLAVKHRQNEIAVQDFNNITQTIPHRLDYFDAQNFNLYPFVNPLNIDSFDGTLSKKYKIYPNPTSGSVHFTAKDIDLKNLQVYNLLGQNFTHFISYKKNIANLSELPQGYYILKVDSYPDKIVKR